jgi:hypothetical protein
MHDPTNRLVRSLTLGLALAGVVLAPATAARPLRTGVADHDSFKADQPIAFERVRAAGGVFVRLNQDWPLIAPADEPSFWDPADPADVNYDWSAVDRQVRMAVGAGLRPILQFNGAPRWAWRCSLSSEWGAPCNPDPRDLAAFATAAARRYSGTFLTLPRVRYWMLLNEPNLYLFFQPQWINGKPVSPRIYRALLNRFTPAIHSVHAGNRVITGGFAPLERPGASIGPQEFVRRMLCMKGRKRPRPRRPGCSAAFDILATNPYTAGGPTREAPGPDDVSLGDLSELHRLLRAADRAGRVKTTLRQPLLWATEFSWDSKPPDPHGARLRILTRWTSEALYRAWRAGVDTFLWFGLRDLPRGGLPYSATIQGGLYFRGATLTEDRPKPSLQAFRFPFVAFDRRRGIAIWGRTPNSGRGRVLIQARRERRWRAIGAVRADRSGIFARLIRTRYGRRGRGAVRAVYRREASAGFSLREVPDYYQPPFGRLTGARNKSDPPLLGAR